MPLDRPLHAGSHPAPRPNPFRPSPSGRAPPSAYPLHWRRSPPSRPGRVGLQSELLADLRLDRRGHLGMLAPEVARVLAALADPLAAEGVPGAGLLDDAPLGGYVQQPA